MILYIMLAYLMLFADLFVYIMLFLLLLFFWPLIFLFFFVFILCFGLLTHSLFISCIILHHAFNLLVFPDSIFSPFFEFSMTGLFALWRNST